MEASPQPQASIHSESGVFGWKLRSSPWYPYIHPKSLECSGGSSIPSPLPWSYLSPDSTPEKTHQMMTPSPEMLKTTPTGHLNCPQEKKCVAFQSSSPVSSLGGWKAVWNCLYPLNLGFLKICLIWIIVSVGRIIGVQKLFSCSYRGPLFDSQPLHQMGHNPL